VEELLRGSVTRYWGLHGRSVRKYAVGALVETRREEEYWWLRGILVDILLRDGDPQNPDDNDVEMAVCGRMPASWGAS
jgi:hypothetical protein